MVGHITQFEERERGPEGREKRIRERETKRGGEGGEKRIRERDKERGRGREKRIRERERERGGGERKKTTDSSAAFWLWLRLRGWKQDSCDVLLILPYFLRVLLSNVGQSQQ